MERFAEVLIDWYRSNSRDLPWRNTSNPYLIWLSEIMLQQTRVDQGLDYYLKFANKYPTVHDLADASEEEVLRDWQGLGYYSRARNLHATAKHISDDLKGEFPSSYNEIVRLKGVGDYTASAIASFAFNEVVPVLDGNVFRVVSRFLGIEDDIADAKSRKVFKNALDQLIPDDGKLAHEFNQGIMEFGALQCVPKSPACSDCVMESLCYAVQNKMVKELPFKSKKIKVKKRFFTYLIIENEGKFIMNQREEKGIWAQMFDFPLIETSSHDEENLEELIEAKLGSANFSIIEQKEPIKHILTHQHLFIQFIKVDFRGDVSHYKWFNLNEINELPKPIVIENHLRKFYF